MALEEYKGVFVFAQQVDNVLDGVAFELLGKGKDLAKDEIFQAKLRDPEQRAYIYEEQAQNNAEVKLPASAYKATFIFLLGIVVIALFGSFPKELLPLVPNAKGAWVPLSMTPTIQLCMLVIAAIILLVCKVKVNDVTNGSVFKSGMVAIVSVYGVAWMAETYFGAYYQNSKKHWDRLF